jgi:hypothetical protein
VDVTNYARLTVSPGAVGSPIGVQNFDFNTTTPTPITYGLDAGYWATSPYPTTQGLLGIDTDYGSITPDTTAYGTDIEVQNATISPDWDVVAVTGGGGGGGSAIRTLDATETAWVVASATLLDVGEVMTVGAGWMEIGRFTVPLDTGFRVKFLATARREDAFGVFYGEGNYLIYNEAGSLTLKTLSENDESTNPVVGFQVVIAGIDLVFEVRGMTNEDWHFKLVGFHKEIL